MSLFMSNNPHLRNAVTRRDVLVRSAHGFGAIALASMLPAPVSAVQRVNALAAKPPHFKPKAKSVIFLFMVGAPSHIDTFDPKPALEKYDGQLLPPSYGTVVSEFTKGDTPLLKSPWKFSKYGQCGRDVSTLFPHMAQHVDDMCFVRSFYTESTVHAPAMYQVNTGRILMGYPSMGSWITYGLGSESENLPAYVVMPQPEGTPEGGTPCWGAGFLPAVYQGTVFRPGPNPIINLRPPAGVTPERQRRTLDFLQSMNEMDTLDSDTEMAARISSYELAFRMQSHAPEAVDISKETPATRKLYGLDEKHTSEFGTRCLLARRLVERGVRFVQIYSGGGPVSVQWDAHSNLVENHEKMCGMTDLPIAGLLQDLKQRGLLEDTLVIWGAEFGRLPMSQGGNGRDHNPHGFTVWLAGGGVKGGMTYGTTDDFGWKGIDKRVHVHDLHATILYLMGIDHTKLTYRYSGRDFRLTDVAGNVIHDIIA
jgi:hypothetical protein